MDAVKAWHGEHQYFRRLLALLQKQLDVFHGDLEILTQLNADYLASDQNGDVQRYEQILAEDFMSSLPDFLLRNKKQFLEMMTAPRPFTELKMDDVRLRLLGISRLSNHT